MTPADDQMMALQVEALFTHNAAGRIVTVNEPGGGPAPRFFLGRSRAGNVWRVRDNVPPATALRLEELAAGEPVRADLSEQPRGMDALIEALGADEPVRSVYAGPAFRFPDTLPPAPPITRITPPNLYLLRRLDWDLRTLPGELHGWEPMLALVESDFAVSLCFSSRRTARAAEAGVNTLDDYRGRGYAPLVVTAWAHAIRASGRIPLYGASWANHASRAVARKLGLIQYASEVSVD